MLIRLRKLSKFVTKMLKLRNFFVARISLLMRIIRLNWWVWKLNYSYRVYWIDFPFKSSCAADKAVINGVDGRFSDRMWLAVLREWDFVTFKICIHVKHPATTEVWYEFARMALFAFKMSEKSSNYLRSTVEVANLRQVLISFSSSCLWLSQLSDNYCITLHPHENDISVRAKSWWFALDSPFAHSKFALIVLEQLMYESALKPSTKSK